MYTITTIMHAHALYHSSEINHRYPMITFFKKSTSKRITSDGATIIDRLQDMGIYISVPENTLSSTEEPLDIQIRPCYCGPFKLPPKYRSVSPTYLIQHSREANFQKDITVRIHHYACEEYREKVVFLSASSTPEYRQLSKRGIHYPEYIFKECIPGAVTSCEDQIGETTLRHFCLVTAGVEGSKIEALLIELLLCILFR